MFDNDILLGELPDVLSFNDGTKVKTAEDLSLIHIWVNMIQP